MYAEEVERECPQCHAVIPVHRGYVTWCEHCNWNVQPFQKEGPHNLFEALYQRVGRKAGQAMFNKMTRAKSLQPSLTVPKLLAFTIALGIHAFTLFLFLLGVGVIISTWFNLIFFVLGMVCIGIVWVLRPQLQSELEGDAIEREDFPNLYKLVDDVAEGLGTRRISSIVIDNRFNAAFGRPGWRRTDILHLGMPLFAVLSSQERVALLGHELGHGANGDATRSMVVGTALNSMNAWYKLLHPDCLWDRRGGPINIIAGLLTNLLLLGASQIAKLWLYLLAHLLWQDKQRAEYLADYMAAKAGGTHAALGGLQKLHMGDSVQMAARRFYLNNMKSDLYAELKRHVDTIPKHEIDRIAQVERLLASRLDATHPPTAYRIAFLQAHEVAEPMITVDEERAALIEQELQKVKQTLQTRPSR